MKLLMLLSATVRGGAEEYALAIATAAAQPSWDTHVALPHTEATASLRRDFAANQVSDHRLEVAEPRSRGIAAIKDAVLRLVRTLALLLIVKPDVVLINVPWADHCLGSIVACGLVQLPTAVVFHLIPPEKVPLSRDRRRLYTWARARHQQWITNSETNRHLLADLFQMPVSDVLCIYNGIKLSAFQSDRSKAATLRQQVREQLNVPASSKLLLTIGRLAPQKGYTDFITILPRLLEAYPDVRLLWAGDGEQRQELSDRLHELDIADRVHLLGHRSDLPRLLQAADLFVFPTRFEGHPFALLEAMAAELPIVTTDASSIPEVIEHEVHGLLCPIGDSAALLNAILWALQYPEQMQAMAQRAYQRVQAFDQTAMSAKTLHVLQTMVHLEPQELTTSAYSK